MVSALTVKQPKQAILAKMKINNNAQNFRGGLRGKILRASLALLKELKLAPEKFDF